MSKLKYPNDYFIHPETGKPRGTDIAKSQTLIYRGNNVKRFKEIFSPYGFVVNEC